MTSSPIADGETNVGELVIAAARALFIRAIADGLLDAAVSPAHLVTLATQWQAQARPATASPTTYTSGL